MNILYSEIQKAVYAKINVSSVTSLLGSSRIYDRYPQGQNIVFPFITFSDHITSHGHGHQSDVFEILFRIDVWARDNEQKAGRKIVYDVQKAIDDRLNRVKLTIPGVTHLYTLARMQTVLDGNDAFTWQGIQTYDIAVIA